MMRKKIFANNNYYHIYNRGVDKRDIFLDVKDFDRFIRSMREFNVVKPIGSLYEKDFREKHGIGKSNSLLGIGFLEQTQGKKESNSQEGIGFKDYSDKLVDIICWCLSP